MAKENRILFVEGADDQHTILAICGYFKVEETFVIEVPDGAGKINPKLRSGEKGGIENVLKAMQGFLAAQNIERLGIVIDADTNLSKQWGRVSDILRKIGYEEVPLDPNGIVIDQEDKVKVGVWIMPDNQVERGYLETFLTYLVPENSKCWEYAKNSVAGLEEKPFIKQNTDHTTKAEIHTFLAWQEEPGKPFGQAITAKYLQADTPECQNFVNWLNRLFVD